MRTPRRGAILKADTPATEPSTEPTRGIHKADTPTRERTLDSPSLRGGSTSERSESRPGTSDGHQGPSAGRLAAELARIITRQLIPPNSKLCAYSVTFTVPIEHRQDITAHIARFAKRLEDNLLDGGGAILAHDKPPGDSEHVHIHGLVLAPARLGPAKLVKWWRRAFDEPRPVSAAQRVNPLPKPSIPGFRTAVRGTLKHAFSRDREAGRALDLPNLDRRVTATGTLDAVWNAVAMKRGVFRDTKCLAGDHRHSEAFKASLKPARCIVDRLCRLCLKALGNDGRRDRHYCSAQHQKSANATLRRWERDNPNFDRTEYDQLLNDGWACNDALRYADERTRPSSSAMRECFCGSVLRRRGAKHCSRACKERARRHNAPARRRQIGVAIQQEEDWFTTRQLRKRHPDIVVTEPVLYEELLALCELGFLEQRSELSREHREFRIVEERRWPGYPVAESTSGTGSDSTTV